VSKLPTPKLLTLLIAAVEYGIPATSLRDSIHRGYLPCVRLPDSRRIWIRRADLEQLIEHSTEQVAR